MELRMSVAIILFPYVDSCREREREIDAQGVNTAGNTCGTFIMQAN